MPGLHLGLVAPTADDCKKIMLSAGRESTEGASGILAISPPDFRPLYEASKRTLTWPNGTVATLYSADEPDRLRGPQHHCLWVDEIAAWSKLKDAWDMLMFGLRLGRRPRACITTTPRPVQVLKDLIADHRTVVTSGSTYDNRENLAPDFFAAVIDKYEGTRLGRQEIWAEVLDDHPGALWKLGQIETDRLVSAPDLDRVVVAVDPATTSKPSSNETGIIVAGVGMCSCKGRPARHGFVLGDSSGRYTPAAWAKETIALYRKAMADRVVGEANNGGDLVESNIRTADPSVSYRSVHASRGKATRAEPVAALYEQGKIHHVGVFPHLEDQLTTWDPRAGAPSPDRLDSLVWAFTELIVDARTEPDMVLPAMRQRSRWTGA